MFNVMMVCTAVIFSVPGKTGKQFDKDERGKYIVYNLIDTRAAVSGEDLYEHALDYFRKKGRLTEERAGERLSARGSVKMSRHAGIGNYVAGTIHYRLVMEAKDGKYRYWLTDLVYQPSVRNRYGKIVPVKGRYIPLETEMSKLNRDVWEQQRRYAYEEISHIAKDLERFMQPLAEGEHQPEAVRIEDDEDWGS